MDLEIIIESEVSQSKSWSKSCDISFMWNLKKKMDTNEIIYKTEIDSGIWNKLRVSIAQTVNLWLVIAQMVKHPPAVQETQVWSLGQEDPLEKEMATHSSILDWKIPWTEECGRL